MEDVHDVLVRLEEGLGGVVLFDEVCVVEEGDEVLVEAGLDESGADPCAAAAERGGDLGHGGDGLDHFGCVRVVLFEGGEEGPVVAGGGAEEGGGASFEPVLEDGLQGLADLDEGRGRVADDVLGVTGREGDLALEGVDGAAEGSDPSAAWSDHGVLCAGPPVGVGGDEVAGLVAVLFEGGAVKVADRGKGGGNELVGVVPGRRPVLEDGHEL